MMTLSTSLLASALLTGSLTVSQTPSSMGSISLGASRVPMLTLTLKASCDGPVTVRAITVHHKGMGATDDIARLYLLEGITRISRAAVLQRTTATAILRPSTLVIDACSTRTMTVAMDLSPSASVGSEHRLLILNENDLHTNASVVLQTEEPASISASPKNAGSVTYTEVPLSTRNVLFGKNRSLLRFSLKATTTDQSIQAITFTNNGSARGADLQNLAIYTSSGERVSGETISLDGERARISFDPPLVIKKNATRLLTLRGDVTASKRRTIELTLTEPSDVEATPVTRTR